MAASDEIDWKAELGWDMPQRLPTTEECTVRPLLERWARETPDKIFALFEGGEQWSYLDTLNHVRQAAGALAHMGIGHGDPVLNWLPNGPMHLLTWLATNYLGAIHVPIAPSARGGELENICRNSGSRLLVTTRALAAQATGMDAGPLEKMILFDEAGHDESASVGLPLPAIDGAAFLASGHNPAEAPVAFHDVALMIYTSGTTGMPKGVRNPYAQFWTLAKAQHGYLGADDRVMISTPLSHISTASMVMAALFANASVALFDRFSASRFWERLRSTGSTALPGLGPAMVAMLLKALPCSDDRRNPLRIVNVRAPGNQVREFSERFAVDYFAAFGMTEASCISLSSRNSGIEGSCGRARPGIEVRLVDDKDIEVPQGAIGEIILRSSLPWTLNAGYHQDAEATLRAWRNGWFHTGDLASCDADGNYFFHDRSKDCIRRRGENISSQEVERETLAFPAVQYAAAIGVAGPFDDQEVLLVVEPVPGATVDPAALTEFIATRLSYFKVPRFVCVKHDLPRTTFGKIRKFELLGGIDLTQCWDRETHRADPVASRQHSDKSQERQNGAGKGL